MDGIQPRKKYKRVAFLAFAALVLIAIVTKISSDVAGRSGCNFELEINYSVLLITSLPPRPVVFGAVSCS